MEDMNMRELSLDEMDSVSGGIHGTEENSRSEKTQVHSCPYCGEEFDTLLSVRNHIVDEHQGFPR